MNVDDMITLFWGVDPIVEISMKVLGGGFKYFLIFIPKHGEMIQFDEHMFQMGWFNHQLVEDSPSQKSMFHKNRTCMIIFYEISMIRTMPFVCC